MIPGVKIEPPLLGWATALCKEVDPTARGTGRGHIMTQACPGVTSDNGDRGCYLPPSWAPHPRAEEGVLFCQGRRLRLQGRPAPGRDRAPLFTQQSPHTLRGSPKISRFCPVRGKARREVWVTTDERKWAWRQ